MVTVESADGVRTYRNHEPERLVECLGRTTGPVTVQEAWHLLRVASGDDSSWCFCIARAEKDWRPCEDEPANLVAPTASDLAEQLLSKGGFTVAGSDLRAWRDELDDKN